MNTRIKRVLFNVLSSVMVVLICAMSFFALINIVFNTVYIKTEVEGFSMLPTLNTTVPTATEEGDVVYINKFRPYTNNDIVVAEYGTGYIIKRLVGKPGDKVQIKDDGLTYGLYVNDSLLYSKYKTEVSLDGKNHGTNYYFTDIYSKFFEKDQFKNYISKDGKYIELEEDEYLLIGDNWGATTDSLTLGPFSKKEIVGKVDIVVPFKENETQYLFKQILKALLFKAN